VRVGAIAVQRGTMVFGGTASVKFALITVFQMAGFEAEL
jgi:hypothetical protein